MFSTFFPLMFSILSPGILPLYKTIRVIHDREAWTYTYMIFVEWATTKNPFLGTFFFSILQNTVSNNPNHPKMITKCYYNQITHPSISSQLLLIRGLGGSEVYPSSQQLRQWNMPWTLIHTPTLRGHLESPIKLKCMFQDCGRDLE